MSDKKPNETDKKELSVPETEEGWWAKFTSINLFVLPFGNGGRGTPVRLFPVVFMGIFVTGLLIFDKFFA
jgi:hypothetical protein